MFKFDYTEKESVAKKENNLILEGRGKFRIIDACTHVAKSGNECLKVNTRLTDSQGGECWYTMYITPNAAYRLKLLCEAIGRPHL